MRIYIFKVLYDGLSKFGRDEANGLAGSIERAIIYKCNKAFSFREMFVDMHLGSILVLECGGLVF